MPHSPEPAQVTLRRSYLAVAILIAAGYGLTFLVFHPGVMTYDAKFVYDDIAKHALGDWQSPAMTVLWALIDPVAPGPGSMFLLIATTYWVGFGLLAFTIARRSVWLAALVPILALAPPAFVFVGMIWRDMLFATSWLLAAVIAFAAAGCGGKLRLTVQVVVTVLCAFGVLLRPNALIAAPILGAYIAWPTAFYWKRAAITFMPAMALFFVLIQLVYYGAGFWPKLYRPPWGDGGPCRGGRIEFDNVSFAYDGTRPAVEYVEEFAQACCIECHAVGENDRLLET